MSSIELLKKEVKKGAKEKRIDLSTGEYYDRYHYELGIIESKGFEDYFLIVQDVVKWAKSQKILVGIARGSAGGSLVSYLMGITGVDPLKYGLLFERFINPARADYPDIDVDFQASRREEVINYIQEKYGKDRVASIMTLMEMKPKVLLKDLARIFSVPFGKINTITKIIPDDLKTWEEVSEVPEIKHFLDEYPEIRAIAPKLINTVRGQGKHASGQVITRKKISEHISVEKVKGNICTCFDMSTIDNLGYLKLDILGLKTLDVIAKTLEFANLKYEDIPIDNFNDKEVFELLKDSSTLGVFQLETESYSNLIKKFKKLDFKTLIDSNSLVRPAAASSGQTSEYLKCFNTTIEPTFIHPIMEEITGDTFGQIIYQEQLMKVVNRVGMLSLAEAELVRKLVSKSKGAEALDAYMARFLAGCEENEINEKDAKALWETLRVAGAYSFNLSHATAYSILSYQTAWLKKYYFKEFMTALMVYEDTSVKNKAIRELRDAGVKVFMPSLQHSKPHASIDASGDVYMGLSDIDGVGDKAVEEIFAHDGYESFDDFVGKVKKNKVNRRVVNSLIQAGVFDAFERRDVLFSSYNGQKYNEWNEEELTRRQMSILDLPTENALIDFYENPFDRHVEITPVADINFQEKKSVVWARGIVGDIKVRKTANSTSEESLGETKEMAYFELDDGTRRVKAFMGPEQLHYYEKGLIDGEPVCVKGHTFGNRDQLYVDALMSLSDVDESSSMFKYAKDMRHKEIEMTMPLGGQVNIIMYVSYHISKNGNPYTRMTLDDETEILCFKIQDPPFKFGDIIVWNSTKKPFANILDRSI